MVFLIIYPKERRLFSSQFQQKPSKSRSRHIERWISWISVLSCISATYTSTNQSESNSKTLIHNIFSNAISPTTLPGNFTSSISDHLPQSKCNIYERDWTKFDQKHFILDYCSIDWDQKLCKDSNDIHKSLKIFLIN